MTRNLVRLVIHLSSLPPSFRRPSGTYPLEASSFLKPGANAKMQNVAVAQKTPKPRKKDDPNRHPQDIIDEFWKKITTQNPGKPFTVLPENQYSKRAAQDSPRKAAASQNAATSYDRAAGECKAKVEKIAKSCRSRNQKYTDPHFDMGLDLQERTTKDTLTTLEPVDKKDSIDNSAPKSVKRVEVRSFRPSSQFRWTST